MDGRTKYTCRLYLKNQKELEQYLRGLCKEKDHPTLEDVKFEYEWGLEVLSVESP